MQNRQRNKTITTGLLALAVGSAMSVAWAPQPANAYEPPAEGADSAVAPSGLESIDLAQLQAMAQARASSSARKDDKPAWKDVSEGFTKVISTADGGSLYNVFLNKEKNQLLAELPRGWERQKHFFAMTVSSGEEFAGLQAGDLYVQWQKINDRLALVLPQVNVRSLGEEGSRDSVERLFTDRVLLSVPIVTNGPSGQPVIDLDDLLVGNAGRFFGGSAAGLNSGLTTVEKVKAFPENIEVTLKGPVANGTFKSFHYSISRIQGTPGFQPRKADERVGFFTTSFQDYGTYDRNELNVRYANRWHLEKADPKLKMSPPKEPIIYYVEHTVPVRYRRWVKEGIEYWNKAFENIGIIGAIEVRYQDKASGAHMEKDPEDVRYNFIRWLHNNVSTAIGPSRVNPETGEILDADVVLTDGWIRVFTYRWSELLPDLAMEGMSPETMAWLEANPEWDPRVRLAEPAERSNILAERRARGVSRYGGHPAAVSSDSPLVGHSEFDGLHRTSQSAGLCHAASGKALALAQMQMYLSALPAITAAQCVCDHGTEAGLTAVARGPDDQPELDEDTIERLRKQIEANPALAEMIPESYKAALGLTQPEQPEEAEDGAEEKPEACAACGEDGCTCAEGECTCAKKDQGQLLDGNPEWFVGPMLAELVAHEVGHTIGLRHNFKGSSTYEFSEINSEEFRGSKPWSNSVMDYNGINIRMPGFADAQGDYSVIDIGPYDMWAIEYGYGFGDPAEVAKRAAEPELQYATDEDTWGPDPYARRYDLAKDTITYARNQMALAQTLRESILENFVEEGESWSNARRGYQTTLSTQLSSLSMMANWVGTAHVYRDKKGDPNGRAPIEVVDAAKQREALNFVIENSFNDEAYGLTPDLLQYLTVDKWWDTGGMSSIMTDPTYQIHDTILGVQASAMTMLLNPTTLQRVYDLERFVQEGDDALTLPEVMGTISDAAWSELDGSHDGSFTARKPMVSSLRRNLQREHVSRLIDLSMDQGGYSSAGKAVKTLATQQLRDLHARIESVLSNGAQGKADPYTRAHFNEIALRIEKALDAQFIYNTDDISAGGGGVIFLGQTAQPGE
ncbi:MAG: zinc-dependent metalloprotease [Phycisphaerales bacterium JB040]